MKKRLDQFVYGLMDGLLNGSIAKGGMACLMYGWLIGSETTEKF